MIETLNNKELKNKHLKREKKCVLFKLCDSRYKNKLTNSMKSLCCQIEGESLLLLLLSLLLLLLLLLILLLLFSFYCENADFEGGALM
jgi:hypothetical protein